MSLAYVFWHWPEPGAPAAEYEEQLLAFQRVLGRPGTQSYRLERAPWPGAPAGPAYEDWYPVADWADLGVLNEAAVTGARRGPHDVVAARAADGAGGVYARLQEGAAPATTAAWLVKPQGMAYDAFIGELLEAAGAAAAVWQRQMVLGPAPEFVVLAPEPVRLPWRAAATNPTPL